MNFINILRKLQTLLEKEELLFTDICKEWTVRDSQEEFLNILENWKWPIHGSVSETENDIQELQIKQEDVTERTPLRNNLDNFKGFQEKPRRKTGATWTEERRKKHKERMKDIWRERKKLGRKELKQT